MNEGLSLDAISTTYQPFREWKNYVDYKKLATGVYQELINDKSYAEIDSKNLFWQSGLVAQNFDNIAITINKQFGEIEDAVKYGKQALEIYRSLYQETQDQRYKIREVSSLRNIALIYGDRSKDSAIKLEYLTKSLEILKSLPNTKRDIAQIFSQIANVHSSI